MCCGGGWRRLPSRGCRRRLGRGRLCRCGPRPRRRDLARRTSGCGTWPGQDIEPSPHAADRLADRFARPGRGRRRTDALERAQRLLGKLEIDQGEVVQGLGAQGGIGPLAVAAGSGAAIGAERLEPIVALVVQVADAQPRQDMTGLERYHALEGGHRLVGAATPIGRLAPFEQARQVGAGCRRRGVDGRLRSR